MIVISPICGNRSEKQDVEKKRRMYVVNEAITTKHVGKEASSVFHFDSLLLCHFLSMFIIYSSEILSRRSMRMSFLQEKGHTGSERTW